MIDVTRRLLGWGLDAAGAALLASPVRQHRAVWHVTVGDKSPENRGLCGGEYLPSAGVMLNRIRSGAHRPDAELRSAIAAVLIGSGPGLSLIRDEP